MEIIDVKSLRQRLGWSAAELARRLGTQVETILSWELGPGAVSQKAAISPVPPIPPIPIETLHELQALANFVDSNAQRIASQPAAEILLRDRGIEQIVTDEVLKLPDAEPG
jgi:transcriptional regulator with XRE-family HTH domain